MLSLVCVVPSDSVDGDIHRIILLVDSILKIKRHESRLPNFGAELVLVDNYKDEEMRLA